MNLHFHNPYILLLLLLLPLLWLIKIKKVKEASIIFSSNSLLKQSNHTHSNPNRFLSFIRYFAAACLIVALARPQIGKGSSFIEASGIDILLAMDVSASMLALDFSSAIKPTTRLSVAKKVTYDFIQKRSHDRIGLIAFAKEPYLVSPLTLNHGWLEQNLERLEIGLVPADTTAIGSAISMALNRLKNLNSKSKVIILLTDGLNNAGKISPLIAAEMAAALNTKIYTIAIGRSGIVPTYYLDANGKIAKTFFGKNDIIDQNFSVDEATLMEIAKITGGQNFHAYSTHELEAIYDRIDELEKTNIKLKQSANYEDVFAYPLLLGIFFFSFEQLLAHTRMRRLP